MAQSQMGEIGGKSCCANFQVRKACLPWKSMFEIHWTQMLTSDTGGKHSAISATRQATDI